MKLQENMYVRTKYGIQQIYKIDEHKTKWKYLYKLKKQDGDGCVDLGVLSEEDIIKASSNIIDVLEVGDYVNGSKVHKIGNCLTIILDTEENISWINPDDIKSIVTKEQFEQISYMLGE